MMGNCDVCKRWLGLLFSISRNLIDPANREDIQRNLQFISPNFFSFLFMRLLSAGYLHNKAIGSHISGGVLWQIRL
jgi:hypothetical protein